MLVIRLTRFGKKKKPFYRIVVAEDSAPIQGKYIEKIGHFNPLKNPPEIFIAKEKAQKWLEQGAKPSDTVWNLFVQAGILKNKIVTQSKKQKKIKEETKEKTEETSIKSEKAEELQNPTEAEKEVPSSEEGRSASQDS